MSSPFQRCGTDKSQYWLCPGLVHFTLSGPCHPRFADIIHARENFRKKLEHASPCAKNKRQSRDTCDLVRQQWCRWVRSRESGPNRGSVGPEDRPLNGCDMESVEWRSAFDRGHAVHLVHDCTSGEQYVRGGRTWCAISSVSY